MKNACLNRVGILLLVGIATLALFPSLAAAAPLRQESDPLLHADMHLDAGWEYVRAGDRAAAAQEFEQALSHYRALNNQTGEGYALMALAQNELYSGQASSALTHFEAALRLHQALNKPAFVKRDQQGLADALTAVAKEKAAAGQYDQALSDLARALLLYRAIGADGRDLCLILNKMIEIQVAAARYLEAEDSSRQMLELCRAAQDRQCEIVALNNLGEVYDQLDKYADALTQHKLAQDLCAGLVECASSTTAVDISANIGRDYVNLGDYDRALNFLQRALSQAKMFQDQMREAKILNSIGMTYSRQAMYDEALAEFQASQNLFQVIEFREGEETAHINIGDLYHRTGRLQDALGEYQTAHDLAAKIPDVEGEATILGNMGSVYMDQGQYEEAIRRHQAALTIWQRIGGLDGQATSQNELGAIMVYLGRYEAAEQHYRAAADLAEKIGDPYGIAVAAGNLGGLFYQLGKFDQALQQFTTARDRAHSIKALAVEASALDNMGVAQGQLGAYEAALSSHQAALTIRQTIGDRSGEGASRANIGAVYSDQKQYSDALAQYEIALEIFGKTGQLANQAQVLANVGRVYRHQGNLVEAIRFYRDAVDLNESVQGRIRVEELAMSFAAGQTALYGQLISALVEFGAPETAFDYAERARARAFLDKLGNQQVDFHRDATPELIAQEQALRRRLIGLQNAWDAERAKLSDQQSSLLAKLSADLEQARKDYQELLTRLKLASPEYASLVSISTLTLPEVQSQVLDDYTTLIEYFILDEYTLAWVVDRDSFQTVKLAITREDLRSKVGYLHNLIEARAFDTPTAASLYDSLFAPLVPHIHHPNLVIVPHGALHYLPFAALWNTGGNRYLVQDYALTYAPSASALKFIFAKRNPDQGRLLALGNPDGTLPAAEGEARAVAGLYGATLLVGAKATESQVGARGGQVDILHLAAHGKYDPYNPLFTRIELAPGDGQDGNLEVHEVYGLDLTGANLVVLSACKTALGAQSAGDEIVGLTRAFLYAGAPAVVTTLWPIDDAASAELMEAFHRQRRAGLTNAEALRAAQLAVLEQEKWRTPYHWAAFSLTGDYLGNGQAGALPLPTAEPAPAATVFQAPAETPATEVPLTPTFPGRGICGAAVLPVGLVVLAVMRGRRGEVPSKGGFL